MRVGAKRGSPADQLQTPLLLFRLSLSSLAQQQSSALTLPNALIMFQSNLPQDAWKNWACPSPCCLLALIFGHTNTGIKYNTGDVQQKCHLTSPIRSPRGTALSMPTIDIARRAAQDGQQISMITHVDDRSFLGIMP